MPMRASSVHVDQCDMDHAQTVLNLFVERRIQGYVGGTANYMVSGKIRQSDRIEERFSQACHSRISYSDLDTVRCVVTECGWRRQYGFPDEPKPAQRKALILPFLQYITNPKFYLSLFYANRDNIEEILDKGFIVNVDGYTPLMQNALILTRHFYEISHNAFELFNEWTKPGRLPKYVAYNLFFNTNVSYCHFTPEALNYAVTQQYTHRATTCLGLERFRNMKKSMIQLDPKTVNNPERFYSNGFKKYDGGSKVFGDECTTAFGASPDIVKDLMERPDFVDIVRNYRSGATGGRSRVTNPFTAQPNNGITLRKGQLRIKEFIELVPQYLVDNKKELGL